ncbi:YceI family protein [Mucilaginibacter paludis]|uniref:YceI family protein n=1 Tax=Mucilaginibacter paludis DSM 18603 TaxID=714943 RepID=H1YF47_9SPHI|nr:YceI family protein [Mucilaginibacter paludis]EHQ25300.1 hypothetical protein Mucpa_1132 [Mucilaginibacter paludis DSM 18603]
MKSKSGWLTTLLLIAATSLVLAQQNVGGGQAKKWIISKNSSLSVNGTTNVNKFSCAVPNYDQVDTLTLSKSKTDNGIILSGSVTLSINAFDCHNSGMTSQLRKTLNEKQFPVLRIKFLSLNKMPVLNAKAEAITGLVEIKIAGVSKRFEVNYQITQTDQKNIRLLGSRYVNFSDFNLVPPSKLGGMIKARDQLSVDFQLNMTVMN